MSKEHVLKHAIKLNKLKTARIKQAVSVNHYNFKDMSILTQLLFTGNRECCLKKGICVWKM